MPEKLGYRGFVKMHMRPWGPERRRGEGAHGGRTLTGSPDPDNALRNTGNSGGASVAGTRVSKNFITKHLVRKSCRDLGITSTLQCAGRSCTFLAEPMTMSAISEEVARRRSREHARARASNDLRETRARLAAGAQERVRRFTASAVVERLEAVYTRVATGERNAG